jgi:hypothetical protein
LTRLRLALLSLFALICPARLAFADSMADAKRAFLEGKAAFERGDYQTALELFERANLIQPAPTLYYNIGTTYERLGRYQDSAIAFDRYLNEAPPPKDEQERKFREGVRERAEANRKRPDAAPQPAPVPPQPQSPPPGPGPTSSQPVVRPQYSPPAYYAPSPYGLESPYLARPILVREEQLRQARRHRRNGIVLMAVGVPLTVVGIALVADGAVRHRDTTVFGSDLADGFEIFAGASLGVVGITLWAPGAASYVKHDRLVRELSRPEPLPPPTAVTPQPRAFVFHAPTIHF